MGTREEAETPGVENERTGIVTKKPGRDDEKKRQEQSRRQFYYAVGYLITSLIVLWLFQVYVLAPARSAEIPYSEFKTKLANAQIISVTIGETRITGQMKNPQAGGTPP
ncbi:MAG TPA: ATP-dependent metallopeptidase FtsH/Yme1/Tma family protein, partial [Terriglobia bacterium]|nr:ATP-dependent metallopeptidase FtsH/Yme1/Tma family protein [Terriglobia bacterium]